MIRGKQLSLPILQGGMGVGISLDRLAGAVAACGGMGTISTAFCGFQEPDFEQNPKAANLRALERQVKHAKELAKGAGLVAINAMVATSQYAESVRTALRAGVDAVVCGAGLPKDLPAIAAEVPESDAALAPVVSGGRAAGLICKLWDRHYHRIMALGTSPNPLIKSTTKGLEINKKGGIVVNEDGLTSRENVYAGGDAVTGAATVILAMGAGKTAAKAIDEALSK